MFDVHSKMNYVDVSDEDAAEGSKIYKESFTDYFNDIHSLVIVSYNPFSDVLNVIDEIEASHQKKPQATEHVYEVKSK